MKKVLWEASKNVRDFKPFGQNWNEFMNKPLQGIPALPFGLLTLN